MREYPKTLAAIEAKIPAMIESEMGNPQVTATEIAWLAGIWDGEGTISVRRNKRINQFSPRVSMVNTNPAIILRTMRILEKLGLHPYVREKGDGGFDGSSKQCWIVSMDTLSDAQIFLDKVMPYLCGKFLQANLLKAFVLSRVRRRQQVTRNSDCPYNDEELAVLEVLYEANGNQRGTSETIRQPVEERMI